MDATKLLNVVEQKQKNSILFALHNRQLLMDVKYQDYFEPVARIKEVYDYLISEKTKVVANYELPKTEDDALDLAKLRLLRKAQEPKPSQTQQSVKTASQRRGSIRKGQDSSPANNPGGRSVKNYSARKSQFSLNIRKEKVEKTLNQDSERSGVPSEKNIGEHLNQTVNPSLRLGHVLREREIVADAPAVVVHNPELEKALSVLAEKSSEVIEVDRQNDSSVFKDSRKNLMAGIALENIDKHFKLKSKFLLVSKFSEDSPDRPMFELNRRLFDSKETVEMLKEVVLRVSRGLENHFVDNQDLVLGVIQGLQSSRPLRDYIPGLFAERPLQDFYEDRDIEQKFPLTKHFRITLCGNLRKYPEVSMRDYFGEKIALFFAFVSMYRDWLVQIMVFGLIHATLDIYFRVITILGRQDDTVLLAFDVVSIVFCVYISLYSSFLQAKWQMYELEFAARYGQIDAEYTAEPRNDFEGTLMRDPVTDNNNLESEDSNKTERHYWLTIAFVAAYCLATAVSCYFLLITKRRAYSEKWIKWQFMPQLSANQTVFDVAEFMRILVYEGAFLRLIIKIVRWQNRKFVEEQESQIILYTSLYQLFNNSCIMIFVAANVLMSDLVEVTDSRGKKVMRNLNPNCIEQDCSGELSFFFGTYVLFQLAWRFVYHLLLKLIVLKVTKSVTSVVFKGVRKTLKHGANALNKLKEMQKSIGVQRKTSRSETRKQTRTPGKRTPSKRTTLSPARRKPDQMPAPDGQPESGAEPKVHEGAFKLDLSLDMNHLLEMLGDKDLQRRSEIFKAIVTQHVHPENMYSSIDREINLQVRKLQDYNINEDLDPLIPTYLKIMNAYSYNVMYGALFAVSYSLCWLTALIDLFLMRRNLLFDTRRPTCKGARSIGLWADMMKLISVLGICTNSFYMSMVLFANKSPGAKITVFVGGMIGMFIVNDLFGKFFAGSGEKLAKRLERVGFVKDSLFIDEKKKKAQHEALAVDKHDAIFCGLDANSQKNKFLSEAFADAKETKDRQRNADLELIMKHYWAAKQEPQPEPQQARNQTDKNRPVFRFT